MANRRETLIGRAARVLTPVVALGLAAPALAHALDEARAPAADDVAGLEWRWDKPHRYYLEAEVRLPQVMWFMSEFNKEERAIAFQVRTIFDCDAGVQERKRVREVTCRIDDIALTGAGLPKKQGMLEPILLEFDERLTAASMSLQIRNDGRIVNIGLDDLDRRNRRGGAIIENLRLILARSLAGLDLQFPKPNQVADGVWAQYDNLLMQAPSMLGTAGSSEVVHKVVERRPDGTLVIESAGKGVIVPGGGANAYATSMAAFGTYQPELGVLLERSWTVEGKPTAGSVVSQGFEGLPYIQRGRLKLLGQGEQVDVGETREVTAPGVTPSALQQWPVLGATPQVRGY